MCTKEDTISTGISIETVKESKLNPHTTLRDSISTHLNVNTDTGMPFKPTSKNINMAISVVVITHVLVIACAPLTPTFLPNSPDVIDPNKGNTIMAKYIIYIL